jgi:hypothetical protein
MNNADPVETLAKIGKVKNLKDGGILLDCDNNSKLEQDVKGRLSENYEIHKVQPDTGHVLESQVFHRISTTRDYLNIY